MEEIAGTQVAAAIVLYVFIGLLTASYVHADEPSTWRVLLLSVIVIWPLCYLAMGIAWFWKVFLEPR
jgi:hypothetical protein